MKHSVKKLCLLLASATLSFPAFSADTVKQSCSSDEPVMAVYELETMNDHHNKSTQRVELLRNGHQIAIRYPAKNITEVWDQAANNKLHLIRYFDAYERGIEYQPEEIQGDHDWSLKRQLVSNQLIGEMTLRKTRGEGCDTLEYYVKKDEKAKLSLAWLPAQALLKRFEVKSNHSRTDWKLLEVRHDEKVINAEFAHLASLYTTDYIDIGDNESDPFLLKMINLGFVTHGASGFYDSEGHDIGSQHNHAH